MYRSILVAFSLSVSFALSQSLEPCVSILRRHTHKHTRTHTRRYDATSSRTNTHGETRTTTNARRVWFWLAASDDDGAACCLETRSLPSGDDLATIQASLCSKENPFFALFLLLSPVFFYLYSTSLPFIFLLAELDAARSRVLERFFVATQRTAIISYLPTYV